MLRELELSGQLVEYELVRKNVKRVNLRIKAGGCIYISANNSVSIEFIESFMRKNSEYIINTIAKLAEVPVKDTAQPEFLEGDSFFVFGEKKFIRLFESDYEKAEAIGDELFIYVKDLNDENTKIDAVNIWISGYFKEKLNEIFEKVKNDMRKYCDFSISKIYLKELKSYWGKNTPQKGEITLNKKLCHYPPECLEFVIYHEFAHFRHMNHSKEFHAFMDMIYPEWKEKREILKKREYEKYFSANNY